jgi:hypothetical protein
MKPIVFTERAETRVMFLQVPGEPEQIRHAWVELERLVGSRRGRKFYGVSNPLAGTYRACVEQREGERAEDLGLKQGIVEGGSYVRMRLKERPPTLYDRIMAVFEELQEANGRDRSRPRVEYYRRWGEVDLLMPVPPQSFAD